MSTTEHLDRILAKCRANLALSEVRTKGAWRSVDAGPLAHGHRITVGAYYLGFFGNSDAPASEASANAAFVTACAGAAEAGWRSTIAAIEDMRLRKHDHPCLDLIIAAWPEELL